MALSWTVWPGLAKTISVGRDVEADEMRIAASSTCGAPASIQRRIKPILPAIDVHSLAAAVLVLIDRRGLDEDQAGRGFFRSMRGSASFGNVPSGRFPVTVHYDRI